MYSGPSTTQGIKNKNKSNSDKYTLKIVTSAGSLTTRWQPK